MFWFDLWHKVSLTILQTVFLGWKITAETIIANGYHHHHGNTLLCFQAIFIKNLGNFKGTCKKYFISSYMRKQHYESLKCSYHKLWEYILLCLVVHVGAQNKQRDGNNLWYHICGSMKTVGCEQLAAVGVVQLHILANVWFPVTCLSVLLYGA